MQIKAHLNRSEIEEIISEALSESCDDLFPYGADIEWYVEGVTSAYDLHNIKISATERQYVQSKD